MCFKIIYVINLGRSSKCIIKMLRHCLLGVWWEALGGKGTTLGSGTWGLERNVYMCICVVFLKLYLCDVYIPSYL